MMQWIVGSSLKFRRLVVAVAAGVLIFGIMRAGSLPVEVLPEFSPPRVEVQTEALGLSADEVEQLITVPLEQDLLNGVAFLDHIESASLPGLSSVVMTFEPGTDLLDARQVVQERMTQAHALPNVSRPPQMIQPLSSTSRVAMIKLSSEELSPIEMSVLARWVINPRLLGVDGVANVSIWGQRERQLQVLVDPERLRDQGVSLLQIIETAGNALEVSPLTFLEASTPGTGGFIDTLNQRLQIFHEQAITSAEELARVPLAGIGESAGPSFGGRPLSLGDVTSVIEDHQPLIGDAVCGGSQCLLLVVEKFPETNALEVTRGLDAALDAMRPGLKGLQMDSSIYRPATFIESSMDNLGSSLLIGAILLLLLLGAFFFNWRTALISASAIGVSLAGAALVLYLRHTTVNTMIIAGLVLALVVLIEDAIVDVENLARRVREHRTEGGGAPTWRTIIDASVEMRRPVLFATLIVVAALIPVFFMAGEGGAFLPPIAVSFLLAVIVSMVVAITVTVALGMILLANAPLERRESPVAVWIRRGYDKISARLIPRPGPAVAVFGLFLVAGLVAFPTLHQSLRPSLKERDLLIKWEAEPGTSLPKMNEITARAVDELDALPGVRNVGAQVGRAVMSDQVVNVNSGEIWVSMDPAADYDATLSAIERVVDGYQEISNDVLTYSDQRITDILKGTDDDVVVRIYGANDEVLLSTAEDVRNLVSGIEGVEEAELERTVDQPTLEIEVDLVRAQGLGVNPGDVRRTAATLLSGITVGNLFEDQKVFDVVVWGRPEIRQSASDARRLLVDIPGGGHVRLGEVADVRIAPNPSVIRHESVSKFMDVSANVEGRDVAAVVSDIDRGLEQITFPLEHHAELLGVHAEEEAARARVLSIAIAAAIVIFLLLQAVFNSWRLAIVVFATLPMALAGGVVAAWISGGDLTPGAIAGFVGILAIAARSVVVMVKHYQHLERHEGEPFGAELVERGTHDRVAAILMTAAAAVAVLAPLVIAGDRAGTEILRPMAIVLMGGVVASTLLSLVVVPAAYLRYGFVRAPDTSSEDLMVNIPDVDTVHG